eukprot:GHUV01032594.1.p1 GENE.GHUV01032594.1~~GHUV01032594.1.p1  ORF type:complete len:101 (+),score=20.62 GHUV01032594.1:304-606(+)
MTPMAVFELQLHSVILQDQCSRQHHHGSTSTTAAHWAAVTFAVGCSSALTHLTALCRDAVAYGLVVCTCQQRALSPSMLPQYHVVCHQTADTVDCTKNAR